MNKSTDAPQEKKKIGRESILDKTNWDLLKLLYEMGKTDKEVARLLNTSEQTINNWKKQNPTFFESLKDWKAKADEKVERSLFERACGYSHPDVDIKVHKGEVIKTEVIKHYPPDTMAGMYWLNNRRPDRWRYKQEVEFTKPLEVIILDYGTKQQKEGE